MARTKLKIGDRVLFIKLKDSVHKKRTHHEAFIDKVSHSNGARIKLETNNQDEFDDEGKHSDRTKVVVKLKQNIFDKLVGGIRGNINNITSIKIDDAMLKALIKDNDND